jgi:chromosome segregation ATPase
MGIKYDPATGLPSNDNSSYEELLQMWREEKKKRQDLELETIKQVEAAKKEADKLMINKVSMYEDKLNRLVEENNNYETISKSHKEINGKLQTRVNELEQDNKKLSKQIEDKDKHIKQLVDVM